MDADEDGILGADFTFDEGEVVLLGIEFTGVDDEIEIPVVGRHLDALDPLDQFLLAAAVIDEGLDRADFEIVFFGELEQLGKTGHGAVLVENLADDAGGLESGEAGEVNGGLGVSGAAEDAALLRLEREDVAGTDEIARLGEGIGEDLNGAGPVGGADPGGDAVGGIDRDGEIGAVRFGVPSHHEGQAEALGGFLGDGGADETASMGGHEVDRLGGDLGGGADEVALVFAVFVIDDDDKQTKPDVGDEVFDGREFGHDGGRATRGKRWKGKQ